MTNQQSNMNQPWLVDAAVISSTDLKKRDDAVASDGLQQPGSTSEALEPRPTTGEKRADHNDPG